MSWNDFINRNQTPAERRAKYEWMTELGWSVHTKRQRRDWSWGHIIRHSVREMNSWKRL